MLSGEKLLVEEALAQAEMALRTVVSIHHLQASADLYSVKTVKPYF
jgi:hypothetical protein